MMDNMNNSNGSMGGMMWLYIILGLFVFVIIVSWSIKKRKK